MKARRCSGVPGQLGAIFGHEQNEGKRPARLTAAKMD